VNKMLLEATRLCVNTVEGRPLFSDLTLALGRDKVALMGRNGVGKSTLLRVLAGCEAPASGSVYFKAKPHLVSQCLNANPLSWPSLVDALSRLTRSEAQLHTELSQADLMPLGELKNKQGLSRGELRKLHLLHAKLCKPDVLILDEPSEDLDEAGIAWLHHWLATWENALLVVTHDRRLLASFQHFFFAAESGCRYFQGNLQELDQELGNQYCRAQQRYLSNIQTMLYEEEHFARVRRRRRRKKNFGRISELQRRTSRQRTNEKRGQSQVSQGRLSKIRREKIASARQWAKASRRALKIDLPLSSLVSALPDSNGEDIVRLSHVAARVDGRTLFEEVNFSLGRERLAIVGPNGAGKTTLLNIILGKHRPSAGLVRTREAKVGAIAQGGGDWQSHESLLSMLSRYCTTGDLINVLAAHKFPLALANRPLQTLSPGERVRAALICLFQKSPAVELLVLDEPDYSLDYFGDSALRATLKAWSGGLIVTSHNEEFLENIGVSKTLVLDGKGGANLSTIKW